jgi:hypothetical protein
MDGFTVFTSLTALTISAFALGWNVYRDVILKARLQVSVRIDRICQDEKQLGLFVSIHAVNLGPGQVTVDSIVMAWRPIHRILAWHAARLLHISIIGRRIAPVFDWPMQYAIIIPDYADALSTRLPKRLEIGEKAIILLPCNRESILAQNPTHVGLIDSFGRYHWASGPSLQIAKTQYAKKVQSGELG